jgi:general secretion pathway protein L
VQKLIIYLHSYDSIHPDWVVMDETGITQNVQHGDALELPPLAEGKQIIVIVPAQDVVLTSVKLPKMNRTRLLQALPFALEEQVIGELNTLHFMPGETQADGSIPVAIVAKEKMQAWMSHTQSLAIQPDVLMPQVFALPLENNVWTIVLHDMAIVRMNAYQGFACDTDNLAELLALALQAENSPDHIHIHNYTHEAFATQLNLPIKLKEDFHDKKQFISDLAASALKTPWMNLLQGNYKVRKTRMLEMSKIWNAITMLGVAFLVLLFLYPTVSYLMLKYREHAIDTQIADIYQKHFPQSTNMVAPKLRMQEKLQKYSAEAGDTKLLILMAYVGKGLRAVHGVTLKRLTFQHHQLTLELSAATSEDFAMFSDHLQHAGLKVKHNSADLVGARVNAVMTVE